jgi:hypothetical protein
MVYEYCTLIGLFLEVQNDVFLSGCTIGVSSRRAQLRACVSKWVYDNVWVWMKIVMIIFRMVSYTAHLFLFIDVIIITKFCYVVNILTIWDNSWQWFMTLLFWYKNEVKFKRTPTYTVQQILLWTTLLFLSNGLFFQTLRYMSLHWFLWNST